MKAEVNLNIYSPIFEKVTLKHTRLKTQQADKYYQRPKHFRNKTEKLEYMRQIHSLQGDSIERDFIRRYGVKKVQDLYEN